MPKRISNIVRDAKAKAARIKTIARNLGAYNYTPLISRTLAGVLVELSEAPKERGDEVLGLFGRIVSGRNR